MSEHPDPDRGKCKSCGFLSKRTVGGIGLGPPIDYEATPPERFSTPYYFVRWEHGRHSYVDFACFRDVFDIAATYRHAPDDVAKTTIAMQELDADRHCESWEPYKRGFSPTRHYDWYLERRREEHREEFEKWMEIGRRDFDEKLTKRQEDFETAIALRNEALQTQRDLEAIKSDRVMKGLTVAALIFAAAQVLTMTKDSLLARFVMFVWRYFFG